MSNFQWKSYRKKFACMVSVAFIMASIVFVLISVLVSWQVFYGEPLSDKWEEFDKEIIDSFQEYVDENHLTVEETKKIEDWECIYEGVTIFLTEGKYLTLIEMDITFVEPGVMIKCEDGILYIHVTPSYTYGHVVGMAVGFAAAIAVFLAIIIPYINGLIRKISKLTEENERAQAELLEQMEAKNEAVMTNSKLITSLSHDFRTPLTRLTGYLEILKFRKFKGEEGFDKYLDSALRNAAQMKNLSDEMFDFFRVQTVKGASEPVTDKKINDILTGIFNDLKQEKYDVKYDITEYSYKLLIKEYYVQRIFDNLFSNVRKYADPEKPVEIKTEKTDDTVILKISNQIKENPDADSNGIGLTTVKILLEQSGGKLERNVNEDIFTISLILPVKTENE